MNISLPVDLRQWVDKQVDEGGYGTASEYIRDMLRRKRERQVKQEVEALVLEAMESGELEVMDDKDFADIRNEARRSLKALRARKAKA